MIIEYSTERYDIALLRSCVLTDTLMLRTQTSAPITLSKSDVSRGADVYS